MTRRAIQGLDPHPSPARIRELYRQKTGRDLAFDLTIPRIGNALPCSAMVLPEMPGYRLTEFEEQCKLFEWRDENVHRWPELRLLIAIPNGGKRHRRTAGMLKASGVRRGVSDVFLPVARGEWHGCWCEMKAKGGKPSDAQLEWRSEMRAQGYRAEIVEGWQAARDLLVRYLEL